MTLVPLFPLPETKIHALTFGGHLRSSNLTAHFGLQRSYQAPDLRNKCLSEAYRLEVGALWPGLAKVEDHLAGNKLSHLESRLQSN